MPTHSMTHTQHATFVHRFVEAVTWQPLVQALAIERLDPAPATRHQPTGSTGRTTGSLHSPPAAQQR